MTTAAPAWSLNLTDPTRTRALSDAELSAFSAPLFLAGAVVCVEVVFWSTRYSMWVLLVRDRTGRALPDGCREVAAHEMDHYERAMLGMP